MELRKHFEPRKVFIVLYCLAFLVYIIYGLQPVNATNYQITTTLKIPSINLDTAVTTLDLRENKLDTPDQIAGSFTRSNNKTLLIGHASTVFRDLSMIKLGESINYDNKEYKVVAIDKIEKSKINMNKILASTDRDTIIVMTCAGQLYENDDASHRLMITAVIQ